MMMHKRAVLWVLVLTMIVLVSFSGCAPGTAASVEAAAPSEAFTIRLPRMYVVYDDTGDPSIFGIKASTVESWLAPWVGPNSLWMLKIHPFYMDWIKAANIQHIEGVWDSKGIFFFVNGKPLPYLGWDSEGLAYMGQMMETFGVPYGRLIRRLLPLLQHIGLDIMVQMPLAEGATPIPYRDVKAGLMEVPETSEATAEPAAVVHLEVVYDEDGVPSMAGISAKDLEAVTGYSLWAVKLDPTVLASLQAANIQHVALTMHSNGLRLLVNGRALASLVWSEEHLNNAVDLYVQANAPGPIIDMVKESVLQVGHADVRLVVRFPLAEGAEPIALP